MGRRNIRKRALATLSFYISGEKRSHETEEESEDAAKRPKVDDDEAEVEVSTEGGGGDDKSRVSGKRHN